MEWQNLQLTRVKRLPTCFAVCLGPGSKLLPGCGLHCKNEREPVATDRLCLCRRNSPQELVAQSKIAK